MCAKALEDRAAKLQLENSRLQDDLKQEQENYRQAEALRKQLEIEIREITVKLEESEQYSSREGRRAVAKLTTRVRHDTRPVKSHFLSVALGFPAPANQTRPEPLDHFMLQTVC